MGWWARLGPHFVPHGDRLQVRWIDPDGTVVQEEPVVRLRRIWVDSTLERAEGLAAGRWSVEARLDDDLIRTDSVVVEMAPEPPL